MGRPHGGPPDTIDLRRLDVAPGGAARVDVPVPMTGLVLAGQPYEVEPEVAAARLDVSRSGSGVHMRLRMQVEVSGPCQRCLAPARVTVRVDAREFQAAGRERAAEDGFDDDLDSAYLSGPRREQLDVAAWAHDAVAEGVPMTILCRDDCAGLCPTCGADLNAGPCGCAAPAGDPRWAGLQEVARRLRQEGDGGGQAT